MAQIDTKKSAGTKDDLKKMTVLETRQRMTPQDVVRKVSGSEELRQGKVFAYTTKGKLIKLTKSKEKGLSSKQLREDKSYWREKGLMAPPYSPEELLVYYESNIYFMRTVDQIAQDVAGGGYKFNPREGMDAEKDPKVKAFKEKAERLLNRPNDDYDLTEMIKRLISDWGSTGWLNMELARNNIDEVGSMYHVPAYTMRVHEKKKKYCQTRYVKGQRKRVWFKKFGEEEQILAEDGMLVKKEEKPEEDKLANEMIMDVNYYVKSDYYGTPNILGALGAVISMLGIRDFNLSFFENFGVPAALVILYGNWAPGSDTDIKDFIETEIRGSENAYKTLVLQSPEQVDAGLTAEEKKGLEWIPLMTDVKEGSFMKEYYVQMRNEELVAYSMPPYRIGIVEQGALGGSTVEEMTDIYIDSIVAPLQKKLENIFNFKILPTFIEKPAAEGEEPEIPLLFKLIPPDIRNKEKEVTRAVKLFRHASLTVNELRAVEGREAIDKDEGGDDRYIEKGLVKVGEEDLETEQEKLLRVTQELEARTQKEDGE